MVDTSHVSTYESYGVITSLFSYPVVSNVIKTFAGTLRTKGASSNCMLNVIVMLSSNLPPP